MKMKMPHLWLYVCVCFIVCQVAFGADIEYLRKTITDHFSENRNHEVNNANKQASKEFIFQEFKKFGLETEYNSFNYLDIAQVSFANVIGILKGTNFGTAEDKIVGLGAHYDTVADTKGVDDNGAGVAAMLEVARQLGNKNKQGVKRKNTVMFVSFDLEEYDYVGSEVFILQWLNPWLAKNYGQAASKLVPSGIIILDTMMEYNTSSNSQKIPPGAESTFQHLFPKSFQSMSSDDFQGDFLAMIYRDKVDSTLATSLQNSWAAESRPQFEFESFPLPFANVSSLNQSVMNSFGNFFRSDHRNFWVDNIPAIFLTDSANFRGDMVKCYHHQCDDLSTMLTDDNINFLGKTSDAIARSMNELSQPSNTETNGCTKMTTSVLLGVFLMFASYVL